MPTSQVALSSWIMAGLAFAAIALGVPSLRTYIRMRTADVDFSDRSCKGLLANLNQRWMRLTTLVLAVAVAALVLTTDARVLSALHFVVVGTLAIQLLRLVPGLIDWAIECLSGSDQESSGAASRGTVAGLRWMALLISYSLVLLIALQNLGVNVTSLIAGLGIGGIAVALAVQNILSDLFASLTIALDKPFVVGDFIIVGSEMGTVEYVGLKTTRVRSLSGEQLIFGNADLLSSRIRNYKRMAERRVVFSFGVVYSTTPEKLEQINAIVRAAIQSHPHLRFDRCHFHRFGASSLDFEVVYYINSPDYNAHMDAQQAVHLAIARAFRSEGVEFAFPTQTLLLASA